MSDLKILLITDPASHPPFDDTVHLYHYLSQRPGLAVFHTPPQEILKAPSVACCLVPVLNSFEEFQQLNQQSRIKKDITYFDVIVHRTDKPFPHHYLETLERFESKVRFVNSPRGLREVSNRTFARTHFPEFLPEGIISNSTTEISAFLSTHSHVVVKTNTSYGGKEVFQLQKVTPHAWECKGAKDVIQLFENSENLLAWLFETFDGPFECVRFLKNVALGDKRIVVVGGEIYGAFVRKGATGSWINNITAGGHAEIGYVSDKERHVIENSYPLYATRNVTTLGYDFLVDDDGAWILSEVNAGNIGGFIELSEMNNRNYIQQFAEWILTN